ncbi:MAG: bifunctional phosphoribosylaminoimidazolecarboxamide formyltransferase/IMP cyclohydrolase [Pseudomonadota bacterium]
MSSSPTRRALVSVSDKKNLDVLAAGLREFEIEILSSGGTAKYLREKGFDVVEVGDFTGAPEMLDGRLKTLHPKIHGGILAIRDNPRHMEDLKLRDYVPIDLVVVNLYPFEAASAVEGKPAAEVIEEIDIGGPTLLRAAAKNFSFVAVVTEPSQYEGLLDELRTHGGSTTLAYREALARRVFERTAAYDATIARYFQRKDSAPPNYYPLALERKWELRYGENPHQTGAFYLPAALQGKTALERVLQGKVLSYNNLMDVAAAIDLSGELPGRYSVAILKHTNPCGVGLSDHSLREAYERALECDPISAFGGIVIFSHPLDPETAETCAKTFTEIVIAPAFDVQTLELLGKKKNLRLLEVDAKKTSPLLGGFDIRRAVDGYLIQQRDRDIEPLDSARVVTRRAPTPAEMEGLDLAWRVAKHVKSNAIVIANRFQTVGIGAGQMSRVDSARIAAMKADPKKLTGSALASDAFFPFRDGVDEAAARGVTAIVQPGGSLRDEEVIAAADEHGLAMLVTGVRHFRH